MRKHLNKIFTFAFCLFRTLIEIHIAFDNGDWNVRKKGLLFEFDKKKIMFNLGFADQYHFGDYKFMYKIQYYFWMI